MQTSSAPVVNGSPGPRNVIANNQQQPTVVEYIDNLGQRPEYTQVNGTYTAQVRIMKRFSNLTPRNMIPSKNYRSIICLK